MKQTAIYKIPRKLYWVSTSGKDEDWFIIAFNRKSACKFHEDSEGFCKGSAKAKKICNVYKTYEKKTAYNAQLWMLKDLGFKILTRGPSRIVYKDSKIYREGTVVAAVMNNLSYGKTGIYIVRDVRLDLYKVGFTRNVKTRLLNLQTGNPLPIELYSFYPTKKHKTIEKIIHKFLESKSIGGEWFSLNKDELNILHYFVLSQTGKYYGYTGMIPHLFLGEY